MKKLLLALCLCLAGGVAAPPTAVAGDDTWTVISDKTDPGGRVVSAIKGEGKPIEFGPVVFLGHRQIKTSLLDLSKLEAPYLKGFAVVPAFHPGKEQSAQGDLGSFNIASQILFDGLPEQYTEALTEAGGDSEINVKGVAQTVLGAGLMAVGAVFNNQWLGAIGMTASANSADFASFIKDDPTWFKSVGPVPIWTQRVVVVLTWIDRRNESADFVRVKVYSTLFLAKDAANDRLAELVVHSYRPLLAQRSLVLNEKQRTWLNEHGWANVQVSE